MQSNNTLKIIIAALTVLLFGAVVYTFWPAANNSIDTNQNNTDNNTSTDEGVVCTMDAKLCPDGSYVGRTGPNCEFAPCPAAINTDSWKTGTEFTRTDITFKYPEKLDARFIDLLNDDDFRPKIFASSEPFACQKLDVRNNETIQKVIGDRAYCVSRDREGAAGSTFDDYKYTFVKGDKTFLLTFTLRYASCYNLATEQQQAECANEQRVFSVDAFAHQMAESIEVK